MRLILLTTVLVVIASGCVSQSSPETEQTFFEDDMEEVQNKSEEVAQDIDINGQDINRTINSDDLVNLNVNGLNIRVVVENGTEIGQLNVNGQNIVVEIPEDQDPETSITGTNVEIKR